MLGNELALVAIPLFVLHTTGSAAKTGLAMGGTALALALAFFIGPLVDRLGFKRTSILADILSGATVAAIPLLYLTIGLPFWGLVALVFLGALFDTPGITARNSFIPDLARLADTPVERANGARGATHNAATLVGPALGAGLVAAVGSSVVLLLDAVTFVVSAILVAAFIPLAGARSGASDGGSEDSAETGGGYTRELVEGLRFVRRDGLVFAIVLTVAAVNFLVAPLAAVILPVYATRVLDSTLALGLMLSGFGAGALAGSLLYGAFGHRLPRRATFIGSLFLLGLPLWIVAATESLIVAVVAFVVVGLAFGPGNPLIFTVAQERAPRELCGRVFGTVTAIGAIAAPLGMVLSGQLVELAGVKVTLLGITACYLLLSLSLLFNRTLHEMDTSTGDSLEANPVSFREDTADDR